MNKLVASKLPEGVRSIPSAKTPVDLSSNLNILGPPPMAREVMRQELLNVHSYPERSQATFREVLAARHGVAPEQIVLGNGSSNLIEEFIKSLTRSLDVGVISQGTFPWFKLALQALARRVLEVPVTRDFTCDLDAIAEHSRLADARIVFVANPENPTGTFFTHTQFERFLAGVPEQCVVVLDEAYVDYVESDDQVQGVKLMRAYPNLVIMRTFSKAYGLAGLRLGYGVLPLRLATRVREAQAPFGVSRLAMVAGMAALGDEEHYAQSRQVARAGVKFLQQGLRSLGIAVPESQANFVFLPLGPSVDAVFRELQENGLLTRRLENFGFPYALRITAGRPADNERILDCCATALGRGIARIA